MTPAPTSCSVVVAGDVTVDWHLAHSRALGSDGTTWNARDAARVYGRRGGAALLADLVAATARDVERETGASIEVRRNAAAARILRPADPTVHHSYALWAPFPYEKAGKAREAWRVAEFLGLDRARELPVRAAATGDGGPADLVVLDDAALGFREARSLWPDAIAASPRPWIVLKMARPVARGDLWEALRRDAAERLVVVMTVEDLRRSEVQISRELSWERTAQDLAWELVHNPRVNGLARAAHVVVSFDTAGAFLLSRGEGAPRCRLFFDPEGIEGSWPAAHPGGMIGYTSCLAVSLSRAVVLDPDGPDLDAAILRGLGAMRVLHREGYGRGGAMAPEADLAFPVAAVAAALAEPPRGFAVADVQDPMRFVAAGAIAAGPDGARGARADGAPAADGAGGRAARAGGWSILEDRYTGRLDAVVESAAREGVEAALPGVPLGRFGDLVTVDRQEIESLRAIRSLVAEYARSKSARPLSIAVFGAPGSGKSFGITQVAKALLGDDKPMTFNLSQLGGPADLHDAFHQVRDRGLQGRIPLVFWDEFDSSLDGQPLAWLRHFLAPMQDGVFQKGQLVHPIGRAIFVFAGGTSETMAGFGRDLPAEVFRAVKGPDFVSRLRGYVDVLGPNPREAVPDPFYLLRRAILLRSMLRRHAPALFRREGGREVLRIDSGVLRAFLRTRRYRHGARSMESIVTTSLLAGKTSFERSSLPAESQLDLHVDARDFLALVQRLDLEGEILERLARAAHEVYREGQHGRGEGAPAAALDFDDLPDDEKEQNRGLVRDIANKLAAAGYVMVPARSDEPPFDFPGPELDRLAEMEHDRWMRAKLTAGWRWGSETDKARGIHAAMLLWRGRVAELWDERGAVGIGFTDEELAALGPDPLPESEKEKDRDLVRGIPRILAKAGYTVLPTRSAG